MASVINSQADPIDFGCLTASFGTQTVFLFPHYNFLFAEVGHVVHGKPLYACDVEVPDAPTRHLQGRCVRELKTQIVAGLRHVVTDDQLVSLAVKHLTHVVNPSTHSFGVNYVSVAQAAKVTLLSARALYVALIAGSELVSRLSAFIRDTFGVTEDNLGMTGSALLTRKPSTHDQDIVIYCNAKKAGDIASTARALRHGLCAPAPMFGIDWPFRFHHAQFGAICLFFAFDTRADCPISLAEFEITRVSAAFDMRVEDDSCGSFAPSIYIGTRTIVIIGGTAARGLFRCGDRMRGVGMEIQLHFKGTRTTAIFVPFPFKQIEGMALNGEATRCG